MVARPRHDDERLVDVVVHNCRNRASLLRMPHLPRRASAAAGNARRGRCKRGRTPARLTTASLHLHDPLAAQAVLALVGAAVQGKRLLPL